MGMSEVLERESARFATAERPSAWSRLVLVALVIAATFATALVIVSTPSPADAAAAAAAAEGRITCSSWGGRYAECDTRQTITNARVVNRQSQSACTRGTSWGISGTKIWVDRGCRANFAYNYNDGGGGPGCQTATAGFSRNSHCGELPPRGVHRWNNQRTHTRSAPRDAAPNQGNIGAFRLVCYFSHFDYVDPVGGAPHLHVFFGNGAVHDGSTPSSLRRSGDSTCVGGTINRSSYWVPAMMTKNRGEAVTPERARIYYKTGYDLPSPGSDQRINGVLPRIGTVQAGQDHANLWSCRVLDGTPGGRQIWARRSLSGGSACPAGAQLTMNIRFDQCWNGQHNRTNLTFEPMRRGSCPSSHSRIAPKLEFLIDYIVPPGGSGNLRLASDGAGVAAGSTAHGDWMNGWDLNFTDQGRNGFLKWCVRGVPGTTKAKSCMWVMRPQNLSNPNGPWISLGANSRELNLT